MTTNDDHDRTDTPPPEEPRPAEQEHPLQDAHGGSMAPGLVDDTGHAVESSPPSAAGE
jgi:hypothetical protein